MAINIPHLRREILLVVADELDKIFRKLEPRIVHELRSQIEAAMLNSSEVFSILHHVLRGHLGLQDPENKIRAIIEALQNSVKSKFSPTRIRLHGLSARLTIQGIEPTFQDLLALPEAQQLYTTADGSQIKGPPLPWLEWLLLKGTQTIILNYDAFIGRAIGRSDLRYIMIKRRDRSWSVPRPFDGTVDNNFITRAIDKRMETIDWVAFISKVI